MSKDNIPILNRLTSQLLNSKNNKYTYKDAKYIAERILVKRGHLHEDGTPTLKGTARGLMTPGDRAIDRSMKKYGGKYTDYKYDSIKNYAYKKKR
mgnify:CR=1 FL=1|tara:strand:- start:40494 stop:40778 length:285 start_codon:yes stop_codon:yes gene_type:complete